MITSYSELKTAIADWMNRDDLTDKIPYFINFAEKKLNRDLALHQWAQRATTDTVAGEAYIERPDSSGGIISLRLNTSPRQPMHYVTNDYIDENYAGSETGIPTIYSIQGNEIRLAPIPDSAYEVEIDYFKLPTNLSDTNTTNWYITEAPDLLLYASLAEAAPYVKDQNMLQVWLMKYEDLKEEVVRQDELKLHPVGEILQIRAT